MPIVIVSTMGRQYKQTFNPISNLWAIFKILKLRFPNYIVVFVIILFTADTKEKKKLGTCPIKNYSRFIAVFSLKEALFAN